MEICEEEDDKYWIDKSIREDNFFHDFTAYEEIGKGVTSSVFKCKDKKTKKNWACKIIQKEGQGKRRKVISSEIKALMQLDHPNIVRMRSIYETKNEAYIVLELAEGGELFDRIVEKGHYSEKEAARVCYQVLCALEYSHGKGIVHRDIKPENILYESKAEDSPVKISDFGFAKSVNEHTIMMTFCGTIGYCAPEVILKKPYCAAVDIWSLGVVLYILLCGYEPFWDESGEVGVTRKIVLGDYEFESPYWDDISKPAKDLVSQMMQVDPSKRPTASEALKNPWVTGNLAHDMHLRKTQERIKEFSAKRKFKAATHAVLAINKVGSGSSINQSQTSDST